MNKIKIIILINGSSIGGTERAAIATYKYINKKIFQPTFCMLENPQKRFFERLEGIKPVVVNVENLPQYVKAKKIDVVYSFIKPDINLINNLNSITKLVQSVVFTEQYNSLNHANLMISKTEHLKVKIYNKNKITNDYVVYLPIDVEKWESYSKKNIKKIDKRITLGRIGRSEPSKWHYLILSTLHYFKRKDNFKNYRFVFAGMPFLYRKYINLFFKKQIQDGSIILMPELVGDKEVADFYKSIDVFLQTAWIGESFGCVIAEAFCFDVAIITDWKQFTKDGKVADLMKYDTQLELVNFEKGGYYSNHPYITYNWIKTQNKTTLKKMGKYGHEKTKLLYSAEKVVKNFENIILGEIINTNKSISQQIYPDKKEITSFYKNYFDNFNKIEKIKKEIPLSKKITYKIKERFWRLTEYTYLILRKILRKFKYDLESHK